MLKKPFNQIFNGDQRILDKLKIDLTLTQARPRAHPSKCVTKYPAPDDQRQANVRWMAGLTSGLNSAI